MLNYNVPNQFFALAAQFEKTADRALIL